MPYLDVTQIIQLKNSKYRQTKKYSQLGFGGFKSHNVLQFTIPLVLFHAANRAITPLKTEVAMVVKPAKSGANFHFLSL